MNGRSYEEIVRSAREAVESGGLELESEAGVEALKILLSHQLAGPGAAGLSTSERREAPEGRGTAQGPEPTSEPAERLGRWLGMDADRLLDLFSFGDSGAELELPTRNLPTSKAARQRLLTLVKLTVDRVAYGRDEIPARELTRLCDRYNAMDHNFASNVQQEGYDAYVSRRGRQGAFSYRLTQYGLDAGRARVRDLLAADER